MKCVLLDGKQTVNEGQCVMVQEYNDHETFTRDSDSVLEAKAAGINDSYSQFMMKDTQGSQRKITGPRSVSSKTLQATFVPVTCTLSH